MCTGSTKGTTQRPSTTEKPPWYRRKQNPDGTWVDTTPKEGDVWKPAPKDDPITAAMKLLPPTPDLPPTLSTRLETLKLFGVGMGEQGKRTTITDLKIGL